MDNFSKLMAGLLGKDKSLVGTLDALRFAD